MSTTGEFQDAEGVFSASEINKNRGLIQKYRVLIDGFPGWQQTDKGTVPPPWLAQEGGIKFKNWLLRPVEDSNGAVTVKAGHVGQWGFYASNIEITNADEEFQPEADDILSLKFTDINPTTCKFSLDSEGWNGYPRAYDFNDENEFVAYHYPLWYFTGVAPGQKVKDGVYGTRVVSDANFALIQGIWEYLPTTNGAVVPALVEGPQQLPEFEAS